jgi:NAD(P)-dependent dehydrogenase (short-subunit alcohol dehydrogenase family)
VLPLQLEQELNVYPGQSRGFVSDVSQPEDVETLCNLLKESDIKIDVLVNNVGIHPKSKSIKDMALEEWRQVFETNVFGPMYLTKVIAQQMVNHNIHGSIIFITSTHQWAVRCLPGYSASKAAVGMIIKELALDLAAHQIRVNGIAPGWVAEDGQGNPLYQALTPLYQTSIDPSYIGRAAFYLASDYFSKCTTGTVVKIDGGLSLHSHMTLMQG